MVLGTDQECCLPQDLELNWPLALALGSREWGDGGSEREIGSGVAG